MLALGVAAALAGCATPAPVVTMEPRPTPLLAAIEQAGTSARPAPTPTVAPTTTVAPTPTVAPNPVVAQPAPIAPDPTAGRVRPVDPTAPYVRFGSARSRAGVRWIDRRTLRRVDESDPAFARWLARQPRDTSR
ncbi:MAG: hypothetical protein JNK05_37020 [Myxococcales bacterium]|nr:hypothetical protein [Myxococcales bacterium]